MRVLGDKSDENWTYIIMRLLSWSFASALDCIFLSSTLPAGCRALHASEC